MLEKGYTVNLLCTVAGVTRSGYYKWIKRHLVPSDKQLKYSKIKKKILECYKKLRGVYGYRKVQVWLKVTYNLHLNHECIQR
ncbi:IS3 family transposase [Bacillus thuringiensis]|uniref:IS3 family transposase n=1 Tax=Bacillus thuringiensis TaxID=1428 RepID=UPI0012F8B47E